MEELTQEQLERIEVRLKKFLRIQQNQLSAGLTKSAEMTELSITALNGWRK